MSSMLECDGLPAGRRRICLGLTNNTLEELNQYRKSWGLPLLDSLPNPDNAVKQKNTHKNSLINRITKSVPKVKDGAGTELKRILSEQYGVTSTEDCQCTKHAAAMDKKGIEWCEENVDEIVGWLRQGAAERLWLRPLIHLFPKKTEDIARKLVLEAIEEAKKKRENQ